MSRIYRKLVLGLLFISAYPSTTYAQTESEFDILINQAVQATDDALITVGYIENGESDYAVYTNKGISVSNTLHDYEVGSITKTFTGALIAQAAEEEKLDIDDSIQDYLDLPKDREYPTIRQLLTHTSGYPTFFENDILIGNLTQGINPYHGITREMMVEEVIANPTTSGEQAFQYSNFNAGLLGLVLESVYGSTYSELVYAYASEDLDLSDTYLFEEETQLGNNWIWSEQDAYAPAGAMISNIEDMLLYSELQLDGQVAHESLAQVNATTGDNGQVGIRIDDVGYQWMINQEHNIIWHDGGTGGYTSYIGFNKEEQVAVIVLSNVPMDQGIPSNLIGSVLLMEMLGEI
ncbi:beta-lactamase family protein [Aerococcaceae bacterium DSM 111021]|nr:beta-lactamase family protein [Aerococcaceae bacterium DSM 111021]